MGGAKRVEGQEFKSLTETFQVEGKPELYIETGPDKGKKIRPEEVDITWNWYGTRGGRFGIGRPSWEANVIGHRVLQGGKLGAEVWFRFTPNNGWKLPRPLWLLDLVREFGPEGWTYEDH